MVSKTVLWDSAQALFFTGLVTGLLVAPALGVVNVAGNNNTTAASLSAAIGSDPGFNYVGISSSGGGSVTYLGNGWCVTAAHVSINNVAQHLFINGQSFQVTQLITSPFGSADLKLFQINGDPGLSALSIASSAPTAGSPVVMIGNGLPTTGQQTWNVTIPSQGSTNWTWSSPATGGTVTPIPNTSWPPAGTYQAAGPTVGSSNIIGWGVNQISVTGQMYSGTQYFATTFNNSTYAPGSTSQYEAQAVIGDSGGAVFSQTAAGWQLAGIMFNVASFPSQPNAQVNPTYGDATAIVDLSYYRSIITPIVNPFTWTGQTLGVLVADSNWNTTSTNWAGGTNSSNSNPNATNQAGSYRDGTSVVFGDQNAANGNSTITTTSVTIQSTGVNPASVTFNNSAVNFMLSNASGSVVGIGGTTGLTKLGAGTVTLMSPNTFTGNTFISQGTLQLGNNLALQNSTLDTTGAGTLAFSSGINTPTLGGLAGPNNLTLAANVTSLTLNLGMGVSQSYFGALGSATPGMGLIMAGGGTQEFSGANTFSGPVSITAGGINVQNSSGLGTSSGVTVSSGAALELQGNVAIGAIPLMLNGSGKASSPAGALNSVSGNNSYAGAITLGNSGATINSAVAGATLALSGGINAAGNPLAFTGAGNAIESATISGVSSLSLSGAGVVELDGGLALNTTTGNALQVSGGTLRLNLASSPTITGTGVTATIAAGATLQLAGPVSALSSGTNSVSISNNSQAAGGGLLVTGTGQQVGAITGSGNTVINAGGSLTATSVIQNALIIGGSAGNPATLTILPSVSGGKSSVDLGAAAPASPLAALAAAQPASSASLLDSLWLSEDAAGDLSPVSSENSFNLSLGGQATVPEPSAALLAILALIGLGVFRIRQFVCRR